jgi:hypothetical protein
MDPITLREASDLCGLSPETLRYAAWKDRLRAEKAGRDLFTTRVWLHEYLTSRDRRGRARPLPPDYVAPSEGE